MQPGSAFIDLLVMKIFEFIIQGSLFITSYRFSDNVFTLSEKNEVIFNKIVPIFIDLQNNIFLKSINHLVYVINLKGEKYDI